MLAIPAVYEGGVFRPTVPVHLAEGTAVSVTAPDEISTEAAIKDMDDNLARIYEILGERYSSGHTDTAARHNEHQP